MPGIPNEKFDLLVIGGGITGCGVARDAAMRGLKTALVERDDFGSGTSGRSSRLVHGGIRYLEHGQLRLVRESIHERETLLRIAPHLVRPLAFTWPIYKGARIGRWKLSAGLFLYQLLAGRRSHRYSSLDAAETLEREPTLNATGLTGGAVYFDARTDDARLTVANAISAEENGAFVVSHTKVTGILREGGKAAGAVLENRHSGDVAEIRARCVVSAIGVWPNTFGAGGRSSTRGSKGVHIAVPRERVGNRDALTLISPIDRRVMFCLPAGVQTIIGTTDTWTDEHPETVHAATADVDYLLRAANEYFPLAHLTRDDVVSAWAGIRPLARAQSGDPSAASREHSIVSDESGIINVTGGKLTTYRAMAAEVVDRVEQALSRKIRRAATNLAELPGADRDAEIARMEKSDPKLSARLVEGLPYTRAHLAYGVIREKARTLSDLLIRRTHIAFEARDHGKSVARAAAEIVAPLLDWDGNRISTRIHEFEQDVARMFSISG